MRPASRFDHAATPGAGGRSWLAERSRCGGEQPFARRLSGIFDPALPASRRQRLGRGWSTAAAGLDIPTVVDGADRAVRPDSDQHRRRGRCPGFFADRPATPATRRVGGAVDGGLRRRCRPVGDKNVRGQAADGRSDRQRVGRSLQPMAAHCLLVSAARAFAQDERRAGRHFRGGR